MRKIREVMEANVFWLPMDSPRRIAADELAERDISGAPVCDPRGLVVGVLTKTDLVQAFSAAPDGRVAADVMTPLALTVKPDESLERAIKLMAFEGVHRLLVVSESGGLEGSSRRWTSSVSSLGTGARSRGSSRSRHRRGRPDRGLGPRSACALSQVLQSRPR